MVKTKTIPRVSVLLPTHNRADVLPYAIKSVLKQTFTDFELLIIGDGCTDNTESIVQSFVKKDPRVQWFPFLKGEGFGYAHRNTILQQKTAMYSAFVGHDDLLFPNHLETLLQFFEKNPTHLIAYTRPLWVHPDGVIIPSTFNTNNQVIRQTFLTDHNEVPACCVMYSYKAMREVKYWNDTLPEAADWDLWKRIVEKDPKHQIGYISTPTTLHFRANWRTETTSMDPSLREMHAYILASEYLKQYLTIPSQKNTSQQQTLWNLAQKETWREQLQQNVVTLLDNKARQESAESKLYLENQQLREKIQEVTNTKGYRAMEVLRKVLKWRS